MNNITAIIQARLGSSRLPGKTLMVIEGETLLGHLVRRITPSKYLTDIIIATTTEKRDDAIVSFAEQRGLKFFRGSEHDVLDRFYQTAVAFHLETIVRVTPDCPLMDYRVIDLVIKEYIRGPYDYVSNILPPTYPDGLDTEVFSFSALEQAWNNAALKSEREHVTPYIRNHPERFRIGNVRCTENLSALRWTVDTTRDLEFVQAIYAHFQSRPFGMDEILELLRKRPELKAVNVGIERNDGYQKSLREDASIKEPE